jgi:hypothetical protein
MRSMRASATPRERWTSVYETRGPFILGDDHDPDDLDDLDDLDDEEDDWETDGTCGCVNSVGGFRVCVSSVESTVPYT